MLRFWFPRVPLDFLRLFHRSLLHLSHRSLFTLLLTKLRLQLKCLRILSQVYFVAASISGWLCPLKRELHHGGPSWWLEYGRSDRKSLPGVGDRRPYSCLLELSLWLLCAPKEASCEALSCPVGRRRRQENTGGLQPAAWK